MATALASGLIELRLRIRGHAILRFVFPLGLALVPVHKGGTLMSLSALGTAVLMRGYNVGGFGVGSMTSLALTGPLLDLALMGARRGWRLYLGFVLAGIVSYVVALCLRGGMKVFIGDVAGGRLMSDWWRQAWLTYSLCGLLAGMLSAAVWFRQRGQAPASAGRTNGE